MSNEKITSPTPTWENAWARAAYDAYGAVTGYKNYQGLPMPEWDALPESIKLAWDAAADAISQLTSLLRVEERAHVRRRSDGVGFVIENMVPDVRGVRIELRNATEAVTCTLTELMREWEIH